MVCLADSSLCVKGARDTSDFSDKHRGVGGRRKVKPDAEGFRYFGWKIRIDHWGRVKLFQVIWGQQIIVFVLHLNDIPLDLRRHLNDFAVTSRAGEGLVLRQIFKVLECNAILTQYVREDLLEVWVLWHFGIMANHRHHDFVQSKLMQIFRSHVHDVITRVPTCLFWLCLIFVV